MQNKPNFGNDKMNANSFVTMRYKILSRWLRPKNKANSNPIQSQFKPIQSQLKPKQTQFKPNFKSKMLADLAESLGLA
ncbi:MAG: hypothetical protein ISS76_19760 [Phycisphaerae bacterium]|nr:hypothetical protein [Phycisphaerae bacterium]